MFKSAAILSMVISCFALSSAFGMAKNSTHSEYFYFADPENLVFASVEADINESKGESSEQTQDSFSQPEISDSNTSSDECSQNSAIGSISSLFHFPYLAAPLSALITSAVTYPLESVKLRLQTGSPIKGNFYRGFASYAFAMSSSMGITLGGYDFLKEEGFSPAVSGCLSTIASNLCTSPAWVYRVQRSLAEERDKSQPHLKNFLREFRANPSKGYWGLSANMVNTLPQAVYFHIYEELKKQLETKITGDDPMTDFARNVIASGGAKFSISLFTFPIDTVRSMRQKTGLPYKVIIKDLAGQGKFRFYHGIVAATMKNVTATGFNMGFLQESKRLLGTSKSCNTPSSSDDSTAE
jgi:hypothetical protein